MYTDAAVSAGFEARFGADSPPAGSEACSVADTVLGMAAAPGDPESAAAHASDKNNSGSAFVEYGDLVGSGADAATGSSGLLSPIRTERSSPLCPPIDACEILFRRSGSMKSYWI